MTDPIVHQLFGGPLGDQKKKKKPAPVVKMQNPYENPFDAFADIGKGISKSVQTNAKDAVGDAWKQLLGGDKLFHGNKSKGGDLQPGQELNLKAHQQEQKNQENKPNIRPAMDYVGEILRSGENMSAKESQETKQEIQQLITELKSLAASTKVLEKEIMEATGTNLVKPGKYHKNFFRFVLSVIRDAKAKIDNAGTWLSAVKGKQKGAQAGGKKKSNYWDMAKKAGTNQFMLSGERSVSNQTA